MSRMNNQIIIRASTPWAEWIYKKPSPSLCMLIKARRMSYHLGNFAKFIFLPKDPSLISLKFNGHNLIDFFGVMRSILLYILAQLVKRSRAKAKFDSYIVEFSFYQWWGVVPVWTERCSKRLDLNRNDLPQMSHSNGFWSVCMIACCCKPLCVKRVIKYDQGRV